MFKTDEVDEHNKKIRMRLRDYFIYYERNHDEDPIYLFDPKFLLHTPELGLDYKILPHFQQDFFNSLSRDDRPDFQWLVIGPQRSGSPFHQDPHATSAWNALVSGEKRWFLYPPTFIPEGVVYDGVSDYEAPDVIRWLLEYYPYVRHRPFEVTQKPGEIIFVPSGWWHMVLNISDTVAVTQNFCNPANLKYVWHDLKWSNTTLATLLLNSLKGSAHLALLPKEDVESWTPPADAGSHSTDYSSSLEEDEEDETED
eukprot:TRINITY_DN19829_c0_g1_i1.p1 TRINITY_DN19829_c0_g1~~TRINITY_DN19829_c0_g1_i1.p1  ORF type:complete len:290 (+),score=13.72 TRINITY_DN19829_c0_g1_i1:107-871(+)